jgi:hypothetical protein
VGPILDGARRLDVGTLSPHRLLAYQSGRRISVECLGTFGVLLGAAIMVGGPGRFGAAGFAVARLVPGGVYAWGAALTLSGAVVLAGVATGWRRRVVMLGLALEGCWFAFFAVTLGSATARDPHVAVTGPVIYMLAACWCAIEYDTGRGLRR